MREATHILDDPREGDVIDVGELRVDESTGEEFAYEVTLRVIAVKEDRVWFKEYGKGHALIGIRAWRDRLRKASSLCLVQVKE